MLVTVYEVKRESQCKEKRFSIHMLTDYTYWFEEREQKVALFVRPERMRISEALQWQQGSFVERKAGASHTSTEWRKVTRQDWEEYTFTSGHVPDEYVVEHRLAWMKERLAGRRLLVEEVRRLCLDGGVDRAEDDDVLSAMIQRLVIKGDVNLDSGMGNRSTGFGHQLKSLRHRWKARMLRSAVHQQLRCGRCNSGPDKHYKSHCAVCGRECSYCEACLQMGRVRECSIFIVGGEREHDPHHESAQQSQSQDQLILDHHSHRLEQWGQLVHPPDHRIQKGNLHLHTQARMTGHSKQYPCPQDQNFENDSTSSLLEKWKLSPAQQAASREALAFIRKPAAREGEQFLIWAVTGAGKTEMVYPLVEDVLNRGGWVLLTAPRRDVVLELAPRLQRAFPDNAVVALYGGSEQRWELGDITISTTHQLLRLERCFDLVVLDELDAFPYHNNPMLAFAARRACKRRGKTVLLTATPPREQQLRMRQGQRRLPHAMVPVRYHRHPLPVPRIMRYRGLAHLLGTGHLPSKLRAALDESLQRGAQIFVFVPRIEHVLPLTRLLRKAYASAVDATAVDGTSSRDAERAEKVRRFRSCDIRILVTTTILERGVTIPRSDVYILDADASLFDEAALVQMAGRAGRSADDPCGRVIYCARERTDGTVSAVRQIRAMNRLARQRGLLLDNQAESRRRKRGGK